MCKGLGFGVFGVQGSQMQLHNNRRRHQVPEFSHMFLEGVVHVKAFRLDLAVLV